MSLIRGSVGAYFIFTHPPEDLKKKKKGRCDYEYDGGYLAIERVEGGGYANRHTDIRTTTQKKQREGSKAGGRERHRQTEKQTHP